MAKIFMKTYGCSHNRSDSEIMAGLLEEAGHKIVSKAEEADAVIINSCTVKDPSEKKFEHQIRTVEKPLVLAGCVPEANKKEMYRKHSIVGVEQIHKITQAVDKALEGEKKHITDSQQKKEFIGLPKKRENKYIEVITASRGCLGNCTYCATKRARGHLKSYEVEEVKEQLRRSVEQGVKEVYLTAEDLGAYGKDTGRTLPELLQELLALPGDFRIRLGMMNPEHVKNYVEGVIEILKKDRVYQFLHIPVQSGSNSVLEDMNRLYSVEEFQQIVEKVREEVGDVTIATDVICGYPTEDKEDFEKTLSMIKEVEPEILNISKFYPRPNTEAEKLEKHPTETVKSRSKKMTEVFEGYNTNSGREEEEVEVLFTEEGKNDSVVGHDEQYTQVVLKTGRAGGQSREELKKEEMLGRTKKVKVVKGKKYYLEAELV